MNPSVLVALANLQRRRRWDTAPRAPFADVDQARWALAEDGVAITVLTPGDLPAFARLAEAASELADGLALQRPPTSRAVDVINELASGCTATAQLIVSGGAVRSDIWWHDPGPVAGLARRVIEELDDLDLSRLRQCQRKECDLLFFDTTRSRSQRWHAENPCGWLERQHRRRATPGTEQNSLGRTVPVPAPEPALRSGA
jgi:predicted RNA-binding Zn ribbon-like protein